MEIKGGGNIGIKVPIPLNRDQAIEIFFVKTVKCDSFFSP